MKKIINAFLVFAVVVTLVQCGDPQPQLASSQLKIEFDERTHTRVISLESGRELVLSDFAPSEFVVVNGEEVKDFDLKKTTASSTSGALGRGRSVTVTGDSDMMRKKVTVSVYERFPSVAVYQVAYENISDETIHVDAWVSHSYRLQNTTPDIHQYPFWSYQSESTWSRNDWVLPVSEGFAQRNYMGMNNSDYGGGTPVLSLWRPDAGLAVGHLEMVPKLVSMPVAMPTADNVEMSIVYEPQTDLAPGEILSTHETFVRVQKGDYFSSLIDYRNMMIARGIEFPEIHESAYETQWCAWGYERDFTMEQVYGTLPKVEELHYHWVVLDDGWQTNVGDWELHPGKYPNGDGDMITFVNTLHEEGFRSKIWWAPLAMHPESNIYESHPDYLLLDEHQKPVHISWWNSHYMCPAYTPVIEYHVNLVRTMMDTWGYHGIKIDGQHLNAAPVCHNPAHNHARPEESYEAMASFFKAIHDAGMAIVDDALIEICPCGTSYAFHNLPYMTQAVSSDPTSSWQIRHKGKTLKALMGRNAPYFGDHVELSRAGEDFATQVGIGAVIGTKFTWPEGAGPDPETDLTAEREAHWAKWSNIYEGKRLAEGDYIGELYDIGFDRPETHVVRKGDAIYFAFYADQNPGRDANVVGTHDGPIELRGLAEGVEYAIIDYENGVDYGSVIGPVASIHAAFSNHILLEAIPQ